MSSSKPSVDAAFICMMCGEPAYDAYEEEDAYGDYWVYCKACDCWTAHPVQR